MNDKPISPPNATSRMIERRDAFLRTMTERRALMGILNVTPDSFSVGGRFTGLVAALAQAQKLVADGADIVDVGAESTRPGHTPVSPEDEWARLEPVLAALVEIAPDLVLDGIPVKQALTAVDVAGVRPWDEG